MPAPREIKPEEDPLGGSNMPDESTFNGETKVILYRLGEISIKLDKIESEQKDLAKVGSSRLANCEKQSALMAQALENIEKSVAKNTAKIESNDRWTKIIAGVITFVIAVGTAAVGIIGTWLQSILVELNHLLP